MAEKGLLVAAQGKGSESRESLLMETEDKGWVFRAGWLILLFHPPPTLRCAIRL